MSGVGSTSITIGDILSVDSPTELRSLGGFSVLKASVSSLLGLNVATRSWDALYRLVSDLQAVALDADLTDDRPPSHAANSARSRLSTALVSATSVRGPLVERNAAVSLAMSRLVAAASDPSVQYQARRSRNFHHSSRLEGIDMGKARPADSLQTVLNRHRRR